MPSSKSTDRIPPEVSEASRKLSPCEPMRRGSLSVRYMKCSKEGCACGEDPEARHGPYHSLTRTVGGKTRSRYLNPEQAEVATQQIEAGKRFRQELEAYWEAHENWADQVLDGEAEAARGEPKKGGSKSRKTSDRKSKEKSNG